MPSEVNSSTGDPDASLRTIEAHSNRPNKPNRTKIALYFCRFPRIIAAIFSGATFADEVSRR
jgi:hypothetical protein